MQNYFLRNLKTLFIAFLMTLALIGCYYQVNIKTPTWNISMMPALRDYPSSGPIQLTPARNVTMRSGDTWGTYVIQWHHGPGYLFIPRASAVTVDGIGLEEEFAGNGFVFEFSGLPTDSVHHIAMPITTSAASTTMYFGSYSQISEYIALSSIVSNFIKGICLTVFLMALLLFYFKRSETYLVWLALLCFLQIFYNEGSNFCLSLSGFLHMPILASPDVYMILQELLSTCFIYKILTDSGFERITNYPFPVLLLLPAVMAILTYRTPAVSTLFILAFQVFLFVIYLIYFLKNTDEQPFEHYLLLGAWILSASLRFFDEFCEIGLFPSGYFNTTIRLRSVVSAIFIFAFFFLAGKRFAMKFLEADNLNAHLENEIQKKTAQQTVFIRSMLHNLKTPMFSLSGYSDMALHVVDTDPAAARRYIEKTHEKAEFAGKLMDQIFFATQLEAGMVQMQPTLVNVSEMLHSVAGNKETSKSGSEFHDPTIEVSVPDDLYLLGDRLYLQQVFQNIVDNARIHTPDSGFISVTASEHGKEIEFTIRDNGCGIAEEDLEKVFDAYFSNRHGSQKSSGLGLYISNEIVKRHNGSIRVESTEGIGTTFIVTIPI